MIFPQYNKKTGKREDLVMTVAEFDKVFNPFLAAQPKNPTALSLYRDIVDDFMFEELQVISPTLVADYARYQALRQQYSDRTYEKCCPHCDKTVILTDLHKRSYDEIAVALWRLIELSADEAKIGVDVEYDASLKREAGVERIMGVDVEQVAGAGVEWTKGTDAYQAKGATAEQTKGVTVRQAKDADTIWTKTIDIPSGGDLYAP